MIDKLLYRLSKRKSRQFIDTWLADAVQTFDIASKPNVLNIGSGGEIGALLTQLGVNSMSLDIDPDRKPDILASVESMEGIASDTIDVVFCLEVLEHVRQPHAAAAEIVRVLRPGALLIGSTPFLLGVHDAPSDHFRFTRYGLRNLFSGLTELKLRERNGYFSAAAVLIYRRFAVDVPLGLRLFLLAPFLLLLAKSLELLDNLAPSEAGTSGYFFIFRKPTDAEMTQQ